MKRNIRLYLADIWESIKMIEGYISNISEKDFYSNCQVQDAVIRRLEIIGEAVKNIDDEFRSRFPQIPWKEVAGMRDIIAHEYFGVKLERIWDVVKRDLPGLKNKIKSIIQKENF